MNTKQVFIILVATLFLAASIVGTQAGTTVKSSKSNSSEISAPTSGGAGNPAPSDQPTTVRGSKSNASFRDSSSTSGAGNPAPSDQPTTVRGSKSNSSY